MGRAEGNTLYYFPPEIFRLTPAVTENGAWFSIFELWMGRNWVTPDKSFRITAYLRVLPIISAASSGETESELSVLLVGQQFDAKFNRWLAPSWKFDTQNSLRIRLGDELKLIYSVRRSQSMIDSLGSFAFSSHNQIDPIRGNQVARYELPSISASVQGLIGEADYHVDGLVPAKFYTNREGWMALSSAYRFSMPSIKILNFVAKICN
jgi:hypothetical protein